MSRQSAEKCLIIITPIALLTMLLYFVFSCCQNISCRYSKEIEICKGINATFKGVEFGNDGDFIYCRAGTEILKIVR